MQLARIGTLLTLGVALALAPGCTGEAEPPGPDREALHRQLESDLARKLAGDREAARLARRTRAEARAEEAAAHPPPIALDGPPPLRAAPALWFEDGVLCMQITPRGEAEVWHAEVEHPGPPVRRVYREGQPGGLFGLGWRSELESRLQVEGDRLRLLRYEGTLEFQRAGKHSWVSRTGPVCYVVEVGEGYEAEGPAGRRWTYDHEGRLRAITPGYRVDYGHGRLRLVDDATGEVTELEVREGLVVSGRAGERSWSYRYDRGSLVAVEGAHRRAYLGEHGLERIETDAQQPLLVSYDERRRPIALESGDWIQRYTYRTERDDAASSTEVVTPAGRWVYEHLPQHWRVRTPHSLEEVWFDARGQVVATRVDGGPIERIAFDVYGRPSGAASRERSADAGGADRPLSGAALVFADAERGRLSQVTTPAGRVREFVWDAGRLSEARGPRGRVRTTYDAEGRRETLETAEGVRHFRYDREHRVIGVQGPGRAERRLGVDAAGRLTGAEGGGLSVRQSFDAEGRLATRSVGRHTLGFRHEGALEVTRTPWGELHRTRDDAGRVASLTAGGGSFRFGYDARGALREVAYPNGVTARASLDPRGRPAGLEAAGLQLAYRYSADGHLERTTRDGQPTAWTYDEAGRLVAAHGAWGARAYAYDADGVRLAISRGDVAEVSSHDAQARLTAVGARRAEHDGCGRLTALGDDRFRYDVWGRLIEARRGRVTVRYGYDALGELAWREVGGERTEFVYAHDQLLAELGPGERVRIYLHAPGLDAPLAYCEDGRWTYLLTDALGSALAYLDEAGEVVARASYDPYGELLAGPSDRPLFFAGARVDREARLVPLRARVYVPELGRFLTPDPSGLAGGFDPYGYADGDPLTQRDPFGLFPLSWIAREPARLLEGGWTLGVRAAHAVNAAQRDARRALVQVLQDEDRVDRATERAFVEAGLIDPREGRQVHSTSAAVNFARQLVTPVGQALVDARVGLRAIAVDLVDPDGGNGATAAAYDGTRQAVVALRQGVEEEAAHAGRLYALLREDEHGAPSALFNAGFGYVGERVGVVRAWETAEGYDFRQLMDHGDARALSFSERVSRGGQGVLEATALGVAAQAPRKLLEAAARRRARRAAARQVAPRAPPASQPGVGLRGALTGERAQALHGSLEGGVRLEAELFAGRTVPAETLGEVEGLLDDVYRAQQREFEGFFGGHARSRTRPTARGARVELVGSVESQPLMRVVDETAHVLDMAHPRYAGRLQRLLHLAEAGGLERAQLVQHAQLFRRAAAGYEAGHPVWRALLREGDPELLRAIAHELRQP